MDLLPRGSRSIVYKRRETFAFAVQRLRYLFLEYTQVNTIASAQSQTIGGAAAVNRDGG